MACSKPALSFAAIVHGRDSSVRVTDDGLGDVIDVVMVVTGKDCNQANACFRALNLSLFDKQNLFIRDGRRYASLRDIITLIMVLPGKMAKELRSQFADIIEDYIKKNLCPQESTGDQIKQDAFLHEHPEKSLQFSSKKFPMSCSKHVPSSISFAEIIHGRDSTVRVTSDHLIYAVDLVMVMTGKNCNDSNECLRELSSSLFNKDNFLIRSRSRLVSFTHAIELVMVLPGQTAKESRVQFANILRRYMAGDATMHAEIQANSISSSPITQMARESIGMSQETDHLAVGFKRRRDELELLKLEHEINTLIVENKIKEQNSIITASLEIERIRDPSRSNLDDRTRLMIQDALQNSILNATHVVPSGGGQGMITNGTSPNAPISIGSVAAKLGYKPTTNDAKRIGADLRKRYMTLHDKPPPKHDQLCDGRVTLVNSYTEQDRPLVEEALHAYFKPSESDDEEPGSA